MNLRKVALAFGVVLGVGGAAYTVTRNTVVGTQLVTGKFISPQGEQTEVGSFPINMVVSPDGRYIVVTNVGFRQQLSVIDSQTGRLVSRYESNRTAGTPRESLYYGLTFGPTGQLYASRGSQDKVTVFDLTRDGELKVAENLDNPGPANEQKIPHHIAGLATSVDRRTLFMVNNQSHKANAFTGSLTLWDIAGKQPRSTVKLPAFPYAVVAGNGRAYVSCERDGVVASVDEATGSSRLIRTGAAPTSLLMNRDRSKLFVSNSSGDTISIVDTRTDRVVETIPIRVGDLQRFPGATPLGMTLSADERTLYVSVADMNSVAVIDLEKNELDNLIDVGWYPTSVALSPDGKRLFVANAKGVQARNPNGAPVRNWGQYAPNILEGTVSMIDVTKARADLKASTARVLANNFAVGDFPRRAEKAFTKPGVEHVIYVIKENRTYDQVLGDLPRGNGDPNLCLFPREVTPNQHALAERFALLDNFYVCAEVSADGWNWSTQGMASPYVARNTPYNYSKRGRAYDFEGTNNGVAAEIEGMPDVATSKGGYIWDQAARQRVSYRNYGVFTAFGDEGDGLAKDNAPTKKALVGHTSPDFLRYDMAYADSEAWVKHGLKPAPKQKATFGRYNDPSRMTAWLREFNGYVKQGSLPKFMMVRLGRDHTSGTTPGQYSPRACVADNDYAVGQLVEAVSNSPFWGKTAIVILEDDAQAGFDHVDAHRSTAFVVSPFTQRSKLDSRFYNTTSMLRTIGVLLGLKPNNQYIATATPIDVFSKERVNAEPYRAILPSKEIVAEVNQATAYRAKDSERLISRFSEESLPDIELNDILWGALKGAKSPRPAVRGARWSTEMDD